MPLYFAYGANMDVASMAARCPGSRPLGRARLARHRFIIMAPGFASIVRDARADVHGVLWDLALGDAAALDRYEEVSLGLYAKMMQIVRREALGPARALVYAGAVTEEGAARPGYLEQVAAAARGWSLPPAYIAYLESLTLDLKRGARI